VVERAGLENRNTRKRIVGSNPTLSATRFILLVLALLVCAAPARAQRVLV
jgi:hypothetical protein